MENLELFKYWGADWAAMATGFLGSVMLARKSKVGFVATAISNVLAVFCAIMAQQWGFIFANLVNVGIGAYGWLNWSRPVAPKEASDTFEQDKQASA